MTLLLTTLDSCELSAPQARPIFPDPPVLPLFPEPEEDDDEVSVGLDAAAEETDDAA